MTAKDLLARLVAFDTTSRNSNLELIEFVADYLSGFGVSSRLSYNEDRNKANLFATLGPEIAGGVVLSGHTDVVPVDGQDWESDPFSMVEAEGRFVGRGTADMKSFIAVALAAVPDFVAAPLAKPIHLAFSFDEEVGCLGVRHIIKQIGRELPRPGMVIVGEPTEMQIGNAEKGVQAFETRVTGREAHSSAPEAGANAIFAASHLIAFLNGLATELRERPPKGDGDLEFAPSYTTIGVGLIEGGTALNIIPNTCWFRWELRYLPGQDPNEIPDRFAAFTRDNVLPALHQTYPGAKIETKKLAAVPALEPLAGSPAETLVRSLTGANSSSALSFASEAGLFQEAGIPTVVCGPGSIRQAHEPNEFIAADQIAACEEFMAKLAARMREG